uniref:Uncharacterized protein n=1 Tax=viral metagenome TaxID=1070528 RepID=A0A6M3KAK6_9ZZZZ
MNFLFWLYSLHEASGSLCGNDFFFRQASGCYREYGYGPIHRMFDAVADFDFEEALRWAEDVQAGARFYGNGSERSFLRKAVNYFE